MVKHNKVFRILALAVILSLLLVAIPATPALAQTITLSPTSGPTGATVTITGSGFSFYSSSYVYIFFDTSYLGVMALVNSSGTFSTTFVVPSTVTTGVTYSVSVQTSTTYGEYIITSTSFTVTDRSISLSPTTGYVGDTVTVTGSGFTASSTVTIYFDDVSKGSTTVGTTGTFTFTLTVPDSIKGSHTVKAQDTSLSSATATFTVSPKVTVTPTTGAVGDTVTASGTGFAASSTVTTYFDSTTVGAVAGTNAYGTFSAVTFTVPSTSRGSHTIKAQDASSNYATTIFTVAQKITINPPSGYSGITVEVTGSGFNASSTITIYYDGDIVGTDSTDATGNFTASFTVPGGLAGSYLVEATDGTNPATAYFTSTTDATIDETTSVEDPGYVGMELTITGTGFMPDTEVEITYESEEVTLATEETDSSGNFEAEITIPPSEGGHHTITVTDGAATMEFDFYMESTPPKTPQPQLPFMSDKAKSEAYFDWDAVTEDEDGEEELSTPVTYDLQIATDDDFTEDSLLLDKTGLTASEYTLTKEEKLESTSKEEPYYWRVRAVDAASNEGEWSGAGEFYVGFVFGMPEITGWVLYALMGAGAILVFFIGFWIGRRSGGGDYY